MTRKYLFIINPVAGKGVTKEMMPIINNYFSGLDMDMKISKCVGDATKIAMEYRDLYTDIISVGGDGTLTEVIDGLKDYEGNLGVLPAGTGNDFSRALELPKTLEECLDVIVNGKTKKVDVLKANDHRFINVASFGIDGGVIIETDKIKQKIPGTPAYVISSLKAIANFKPYSVRIKIDDQTIDREIVLAAVGNGKYFGGGMYITPEAKLDDKLLDVVIATKTSKMKLINLFSKLFKGTHMDDPCVEHYKCKQFSIESSDDIYINTDGNLIGRVPATITIEDNKMNILVP